jgi:hypothetical protein
VFCEVTDPLEQPQQVTPLVPREAKKTGEARPALCPTLWDRKQVNPASTMKPRISGRKLTNIGKSNLRSVALRLGAAASRRLRPQPLARRRLRGFELVRHTCVLLL